MKRQIFFPIVVLFLHASAVFSQDFVLTMPRLDYDGSKLTISYDLISKNQSDIFFIWVEMTNQSGTLIRFASFKGEVGDSIKPGNNKTITWVPDDDAIYIDEDVTIELRGEEYVRAFNKGSALLSSAVVPGLGLAKIRKSKAWWLMSIPAYGSLAGGILMNKKYHDTYELYQTETDAVERQDLYDKSRQQLGISGICLVSSAVLWAGNMVWIAATPNNYRPLQHVKVSVSSVPAISQGITLLSLKVDF